jgi:hypothetical protein
MEKIKFIAIFIMMIGFSLFVYGIVSFNTEKNKWVEIKADISKINIIENEKLSKNLEIYYTYNINDTVYNNKLKFNDNKNLNQLVDKYRSNKKIDLLYNINDISETINELPTIGINFMVIGSILLLIGFGTGVVVYDNTTSNQINNTDSKNIWLT